MGRRKNPAPTKLPKAAPYWEITHPHAIQAVWDHRPEQAISLHLASGAHTHPAAPGWIAAADQFGIPIQTSSDPQRPFFFRCRAWEWQTEGAFWDQPDPEHPPCYLLLDQITDPHNMGACLRSAEAAGVDAVFVPEHGRSPMTAVVLQTSSGAAAAIPCYTVKNFSRWINQLKAEKNCWVMGADLDGKPSLYTLDLTVPVAWVLGSEGKGLRPLTRTHCDQLFHIPMYGTVQSLNVSVATGIILFETCRQRQARAR